MTFFVRFVVTVDDNLNSIFLVQDKCFNLGSNLFLKTVSEVKVIFLYCIVCVGF